MRNPESSITPRIPSPSGNVIEAYRFIGEAVGSPSLIPPEIQKIMEEASPDHLPHGKLSVEVTQILRKNQGIGGALFRPRTMRSFLGKIGILSKDTIADEEPFHDTIESVTKDREGHPSIEDSYLVITHPDEIAKDAPQRGTGSGWEALWMKAIRFLHEEEEKKHGGSSLQDYLRSEGPIVIGYHMEKLIRKEDDEKGESGEEGDEEHRLHFDYTGPEEFREFFESLFREFSPLLEIYEHHMISNEIRQTQDALKQGITFAIPFIGVGVAIDHFYAPTTLILKIIEMIMRTVQGNLETIVQVYTLRKRMKAGENVGKAYSSCRDALLAGTMGSIPLAIAPLVGVDLHDIRYAIPVTIAASSDNAFEATSKLLRNYHENRKKGLSVMKALNSGFENDLSVQGNYLGTVGVLTIDLLLRFLLESTSTGFMLKKVSGIASEGGALGITDSIIAAFYMTMVRMKRFSQWGKAHFNESELQRHASLTQRKGDHGSSPPHSPDGLPD